MTTNKLPFQYWSLAVIALASCGLTVLMISIVFFKDRSAGLARLPHFYGQNEEYKAEPYMLAAVKLQSMGRQKAEQEMMQYANKGWNSDGIFILCRMLYTNRPSCKFEAPGLGVPELMGGTEPKDWPLQPIEIENGIPFLITMGYSIYGQPPYPPAYLKYCMTNCNWNTFRYEKKGKDELRLALNEMLNSTKWKRPLTQDEKSWLSAQIY